MANATPKKVLTIPAQYNLKTSGLKKILLEDMTTHKMLKNRKGKWFKRILGILFVKFILVHFKF